MTAVWSLAIRVGVDQKVALRAVTALKQINHLAM